MMNPIQKIKILFQNLNNKFDKNFKQQQEINKIAAITKIQPSIKAINPDFSKINAHILNQKDDAVKYAPSSLKIIKEMIALAKFAECINSAPDLNWPMIIAFVFGGCGLGIVIGVIFKIGWPICAVCK